MKFFFSTAMAVLFVTASATAQHANIGIKGGLNVFTIHTNDNASYDTRKGINLGLMYISPVKWHFSRN